MIQRSRITETVEVDSAGSALPPRVWDDRTLLWRRYSHRRHTKKGGQIGNRALVGGEWGALFSNTRMGRHALHLTGVLVCWLGQSMDYRTPERGWPVETGGHWGSVSAERHRQPLGTDPRAWAQPCRDIHAGLGAPFCRVSPVAKMIDHQVRETEVVGSTPSHKSTR